MNPRYRYLLARLAGAQPEVLRDAATDRTRHTAMGGVLLTTAGVAGLSAGFALNTAVKLPVAASVLLGLLWAIAILNLDRMLIVSMSKQSGTWRNLVTAGTRLLLAIVIGAIVSTPLVLKIFEREINAELQDMHTENVIAGQESLAKLNADIDAKQTKVDGLQGVASGQKQPSVSDDPDVKAAQTEVDKAQTAADEAGRKAQCELDGSCGTGQRGDGRVFREADAKADAANEALDGAQAKLAEATRAAQGKISGSAQSNKDAAQRELDQELPLLKQLKDQRADLLGRQGSSELDNEGLLARLAALDRLSAESSLMWTAHAALFLLFMLIEILPVVVKVLAVFGGPTRYDEALARHEGEHEAQAEGRVRLRRQLEEDRIIGQLNAGQKANALLVQKQSEIAERAIEVWGAIATHRSEAELAAWFARHSGGAVMPAPVTPAPVMPAPVTPAPAPAGSPPPAAPAAPVVPAQSAAPGSYEWYRSQHAQAAVPVAAVNGHAVNGSATP